MLRGPALAVAALSAAALLLETALTRLLAVAQFYHFAFLAVSLALLGFGASGTLLSAVPRLRALPLDRLLAWTGAGFALATALAYAAVNWLPLDTYSIAWDRGQLLWFGLYYLALTLPFICGGLAVGGALMASQGRSHLIYAANLLGSAAGVLLAAATLRLAGVPGAVLAAALLALLPALRWAPARVVALAGLAGLVALSGLNLSGRAPVGMTLSPYKGLAQARHYQGARVVFGQWDAAARVDVLAGASTHLLPGLSYAYDGVTPPQEGLFVDADAAQPITLAAPDAFGAAAFMPEAIAFQLRPAGQVLVLGAGGGLGVLQAISGGAAGVTAVVDNPLTRQALARAAPGADVYGRPDVRTVVGSDRVFMRQDRARYDVVFMPLTDAYRPVSSGAYSLAEAYLLTTEAFEAALDRTAPDGLLVTTRWLQTPPSESLRLVATLAEALRRRGVARPDQALAAYRGIQTVTVLARPGGWQPAELAALRAFAQAKRYDLVWAPDIRAEETNRYSRLPAPADFAALQRLLKPGEAPAFIAAYPFAIMPATDDRPFFYHFFRWGQTGQVLAELGHTWQPFGGSGYLVLFALLALVLLLSGLLIAAPPAMAALARAGHERQGLRAAEGASTHPGRPGGTSLTPAVEPTGATVGCTIRDRAGREPSAPGSAPARERNLAARGLACFGLLGIGYLFIEIPLIQRWMLLFERPTYAFTVVVLTLLLFSSLGSALARAPWLRPRAALAGLVAVAVLTGLLSQALAQGVLAWPGPARVLVAVAVLAPLATLMGLPFPLGLACLEAEAPGLIPWAWAVNGCASVVAAVLAAILALSYGFTTVLLLGAGAYAGAVALLAGLLPRAGLPNARPSTAQKPRRPGWWPPIRRSFSRTARASDSCPAGRWG